MRIPEGRHLYTVSTGSDIGRNDHQEDLPHFMISDILLLKIETKKSKGKSVKIHPIHSRYSNDYM